MGAIAMHHVIINRATLDFIINHQKDYTAPPTLRNTASSAMVAYDYHTANSNEVRP
jgi:hypothetical protein